MADRARDREPLSQRRERALARLDAQRTEMAAQWYVLTGVVRERERGVLALAQGLATAVKIGGAVAAVWMAGRIRGPRLVRRGAMLLTAARSAGNLLGRRHHARGGRWQKA